MCFSHSDRLLCNYWPHMYGKSLHCLIDQSTQLWTPVNGSRTIYPRPNCSNTEASLLACHHLGASHVWPLPYICIMAWGMARPFMSHACKMSHTSSIFFYFLTLYWWLFARQKSTHVTAATDCLVAWYGSVEKGGAEGRVYANDVSGAWACGWGHNCKWRGVQGGWSWCLSVVSYSFLAIRVRAGWSRQVALGQNNFRFEFFSLGWSL
jgi:hypothetical protein